MITRLTLIGFVVGSVASRPSPAHDDGPSGQGTTCNYSEEDRPVFEAGQAPPIFLPQNRGARSPAALDGTPYGL
jgi:hypothetical protein